MVINETDLAGPRELVVGERVRELRTGLNLSVRTLASKAGFSPSFVSQLENGIVSPSIASLERIVSVLGTTLSGFFTTPTYDQETGHQTHQELASSWSRARIEPLMHASPGTQLEVLTIVLAPGGRSGKHPSSHAGEEFAIVLEGEVSFVLGEVVRILKQGDTVNFQSSLPHLWENQGGSDARIIIVSPRLIA